MDRLINSPFKKLLFGLGLWLVFIASVRAQDLGDLSLEQLLNVEVTSASRKTQNLGDVAAAIFVLTAEDIRRSGATSIPEALRMVPGVHVGRIDDNRWAVSARGFNDQYSNKLLVLMDGRHIYTPHYAGVFWDHHSMSIDNIERIEVIRGPGATLWGSNAVNGVINIISRSARDTQGVFLQARAGGNNSHSVAARFGGVTENGWYYRVDFNGIEEDFMDSVIDPNSTEYWRQHKTSFRIEGSPLAGHEVKIDGAHYDGNARDVVNTLDFTGGAAKIMAVQDSLNTEGGWLALDWARQSDSGEGWRVKSYYDKAERDQFFAQIDQTTWSMDFQSRHLLGSNHDLVWGIGYRHLDLPFMSRAPLFEERVRIDSFQLAEVFVQDEIELTENVALIVGAKVEDSEFVDVLVQPNVRLNWQINEDFSLWGSVSRAARTPAVGERNIAITPNQFFAQIPNGGQSTIPLGITIVGGDGFDSEWLDAYEFGVRGRLGDRLDFDLAAFHFQYEDLRSANAIGFVCQPGNISLLTDPNCQRSASLISTLVGLENETKGESTGVELALQWQATENWRLSSALSWFDYDLEQVNTINRTRLYDEPGWIANIRSQWSLGANTNLDITVRGVDESPVYDLESYVTADVRLEWRPAPQWTVEIIGQNLLEDGHMEYGSVSFETDPGMVRRSVMARISWAP